MNYAARGSYSNYSVTAKVSVRLLINVFILFYVESFLSLAKT
jgi:hypothetical protein